jgi:hypothetical protein
MAGTQPEIKKPQSHLPTPVLRVLDHDPTPTDITRFFRRFRAELDRRSLTLRGITPDGSALYLKAIAS